MRVWNIGEFNLVVAQVDHQTAKFNSPTKSSSYMEIIIIACKSYLGYKDSLLFSKWTDVQIWSDIKYVHKFGES